MFGLTTLGTWALSFSVYLAWWAISRVTYAMVVGFFGERTLNFDQDWMPITPGVGEIAAAFLLALVVGVFIPIEGLNQISKVAKKQGEFYTLKTKEVRKEDGQLSIPSKRALGSGGLSMTGEPP